MRSTQTANLLYQGDDLTMEKEAGFGKCDGARTPTSVALPRPLCKAGDVALGACLAAVGVKPVKVKALNRYLPLVIPRP